MAACGRVLAERGWPVTILTKSSLIERDLDLWEEVNGKGGFLLMVSLMTLDEALRAVFEPSASPVEKRLETLRAFKRRGCSIGVAAMPFLPFLADRDGDFEALASRLAESASTSSFRAGSPAAGTAKGFLLRCSPRRLSRSDEPLRESL